MESLLSAAVVTLSVAGWRAGRRWLYQRRTAQELVAVRLSALRQEQAIADVVTETQRQLVETYVRAQLERQLGAR